MEKIIIHFIRIGLLLTIQYANAQERNLTGYAYSLFDTTLAMEYFSKAETFEKQAKYDSSIFYFGKASVIYEKMGVQHNKPEYWEKYLECYNSIADNFRLKAEYEKAITYLNKALEAGTKRLGDKNLAVAQNYHIFGIVYSRKGKYKLALEYHQKALSLFRQNLGENHAKVASSYNSIANVYEDISEYDNALKYYHKAIPIFQQTVGENHEYVAACYNNMGIVYKKKGDYDTALKYYRKALMIRLGTLVDNHPDIAGSYYNIGVIYKNKGDYDKALKFYQKSLSIELQVLGEIHPNVAGSYSSIGNIYESEGDYDNALEYHQKALSIFLKTLDKEHPWLAYTYGNIGIAYRRKGDYEKALKNYQKALSIFLHKLGKDHPNVAYCYNNIATVYYEQGNNDKALDFHQKALSVWLQIFGEKHPDVATSYNDIGSVYLKKNDYKNALAYYQKSLSISLQTLGDKHPWIADTYQNIGKVYDKQRDFARALHYYQKSIIASVTDFYTEDITANPVLRKMNAELVLFASLTLKAQALAKRYTETDNIESLELSLSTYKLSAELIDRIKSGYKAEGSKLFLGEKTHTVYDKAIQIARELYETTGKKNYQEQAFFFAEKSKSAVLQEALLEANAQRFAGIPDSLLEKEKSLKIDLAFYDTARQKEKQKKTAKQDSLKIRDFEDRYFDLNRQYQKLVEQFEKEYPRYFGLKYRTQTVTVANIQEQLDPKTAVLEYFVGDSVLTIFIISKDDFEVAAVEIDSTFDHFVQQLPLNIKRLNRKAYLKNAYLLYERLIAPVEKHLAGKEKLAIIPHGRLFYLPFEAILTEEAETENYNALPYFIKKHSISYHYSATLFVNSFKTTRTNAKGFFGIAPVVFRERTVPEKFLAMVREVFRDSTLQDLQASKTEVSTIAALFQKNQQLSDLYFYEDAKEDRLKSASIKDYRYLHIATHGLINEDKPKLSHLVFSQSPDSDVQDDGILYASEIFNLDLNADLVVLSSCESGIGKLVKGEGMLAINRGFLYAGADNIVFSLWKVPDKHTSRLMIEFYKQILSQGGFPSGRSYSRSLRAAKLKLIANEETAHPSNWSGFVLVGR